MPHAVLSSLSSWNTCWAITLNIWLFHSWSSYQSFEDSHGSTQYWVLVKIPVLWYFMKYKLVNPLVEETIQVINSIPWVIGNVLNLHFLICCKSIQNLVTSLAAFPWPERGEAVISSPLVHRTQSWKHILWNLK